MGLKLLLTGAPAVLSSGSLVLAVQKVNGSDFPEMSVNIVNTENVQVVRLSSLMRPKTFLGFYDAF